MFTCEHLIAHGLDIGLTDQRQESIENGLRDQIFGVIEQEGNGWVIRRDIFFGETREARGILREEIFQDKLGMLRVVDLLELLPGFVFCTSCHRPFDNQ